MQVQKQSKLRLWIAAIFVPILLLLLSMLPDKNSNAHLQFTPLSKLEPLVYTELNSPLAGMAAVADSAYTTVNGTKYHLSSDCSALKRSKNVQQSDMASAQRKYAPCALCVDN